jgi:putative endopeptidase
MHPQPAFTRMIAILLSAAAPLAISPAAAADAASAGAATAKAKGGPVLGTFGVDTAGMDTAVKPGDNFFAHVNGAWDKATPIPDDRASWGMFNELQELSQTRTRAIVEEAAAATAATGNTKKIGDFYASLVDEAAIEKAGLAPIQGELDAVAAIRSPADVTRFFARANREGGPSPVRVGVGQDLKDPSKMTVNLFQSGLGMPNRDYYLEARFAPQKAAYEQHVARLLALSGIPEADAKAQAARVVALETEIAKAHWTNVENRQAEKRYNPTPVTGLAAAYPGLDWGTFRTIVGIEGETSLNVAQPSAVAGIAKLAETAPVADWQAWGRYHLLRTAAQTLPKAYRDETFAFYGKTLSGTPQQEERWKQAVNMTTGALGDAIGQEYVERHFPPEAKAQMDELVKNIIVAMDKRLAGLAWMDPKTREAARFKLSRFTPKIGYPDKWRDYSDLKVVRGDPVGNARREYAFEFNRNLAKLGKPIDRSEWFMTPMTVNAYANPTWNEIVFPAAILQPPFFDPKADPAVNYGGIGAVIGHEITHHFDDQGRKYDPDGKLSDWWTPADVERFTKLSDVLVKQVEAYEPLPGKRINGKLSLGENIADIAGLNIAWDAWQMSLKGKPAPLVDGKSGAERFYLGYGQIWRTKYRDAAMERQLTVGPHSPGNFRPLTVRNHAPWYETFGVKPGEKLFLTEEERVGIW